MQPDFHVIADEPIVPIVANKRGHVDGYTGLYNFRHHFCAAKGTRLYGPLPQLTLNHSQFLDHDIRRAVHRRIDYKLLGEFLNKPRSNTAIRVFTAISWFNAANEESNDQAAAIVKLSIAFESLLSLPKEEKTDRLVDTISMLLGRIPRLDVWARQFYDARSRVVHEGRPGQIWFIVPQSKKDKNAEQELPQYQSLLSYGRQIFQLCLGTLLTGAELAEEAGLEEKFVTNQERFRDLCKLLEDSAVLPTEKIKRIEPLIAAIQRYRYVPEPQIQLSTMIGAMRLAAKTLLEVGNAVSEELGQTLDQMANAPKSKDHFEELQAIERIKNTFDKLVLPEDAAEIRIVREVVEAIWAYVFLHYFWLKEQHEGKNQDSESNELLLYQ